MTRKEKISLVVNTFLKYPNLTMAQLADLPELKDISKSSIQRYLNDPVICQLFNEEVFNNIKNILTMKGMGAKRKGGFNSFQNNLAVKDNNGQFRGVKKAENNDNINRKIKHILTFAQLFLENPELSLQDIADLYNEMNPGQDPVTRDYVYDCLSDQTKYEVFSEKMAKQLAYLLEQRRLLGNSNGAIIVNETRGQRK